MAGEFDVLVLNLPVKPVVIVMPEPPALPEPFLSMAIRVHWAPFDFKRHVGALFNHHSSHYEIETRVCEARQKKESGITDVGVEAVLEAGAFCDLVKMYADARDRVTHLKRTLGECGVPHVVVSPDELELSALEAARAELDMRRDLPGAKKLAEALE